MKKKLLNYIVCPNCSVEFTLKSFITQSDEIVDGLLICNSCQNAYPIIGAIPRILPDAFNNNPRFYSKYKCMLQEHIKDPIFVNVNSRVEVLKKKTQKSFGYQWTNFSELACDFKDNFLNYIFPVKEDFFKGKIGLDAGCGFGRHIYNAALLEAEMIGIDYSSAIESTFKNTNQLSNVYLVQCDIYKLPFKKDLFDFIYCIGVLHHLPEPEKGFLNLINFLKVKGSIFIWVYSKRRKVLNFLLEIVRKFSVKIPYNILKIICLTAAIIDWTIFICPYKLLNKLGVFSENNSLFRRLHLYSKYPFQVVYADWFDRLSPPIRYYYDDKDMAIWANHANLENVAISPTELYGWRLLGKKT